MGMKQDWFTVERLDGDTFAISEYGHREEPHSYLLLGAERALLIDAGLGIGRIGAVVSDLTALPVTAAVTHVHWDHIGGLGDFERIAVHENELQWLKAFPLPRERVRELVSQGLRRSALPEGFDLCAYTPFQGEAQRTLRDGDLFDLGGRAVEVIHTPGHSPGHCCFYERDRGFLFTGDLIYAGQLDVFYPSTDPVAFRQSVKRVAALSPVRVFPGHHSLEIGPELIAGVDEALCLLEREDKLRHGSGLFAFDGFQIRL